MPDKKIEPMTGSTIWGLRLDKKTALGSLPLPGDLV